jgi:putative spermidine/putrescine transport system permease protein
MTMAFPTRVLLGLFCLLISIWLLAPTLVVIPISFNEKKSLAFPPSGFSWQWYRNFFTNPEWSTSFFNSLKVAAVVAVLATVLGTLAAFGLDRMKSSTRGILRAFLITPMVIPGVVLGIGVYAVYLDTQLVGTLPGFVLAHTMLAIPFVLIAVGASLEVFDKRLETAAASLGAGRWTTFRTITLPLIAPGLLSGLLFAFVTSFDEIIVALFITSPYLKTLPVQIFSSITRDADPTVAAVGTILFQATTLLISAGLLIGAQQRRN